MPMRLQGSCRCGAISFSVDSNTGPKDDQFDGHPELSIEEWNKKHKLWIK